MTLWLDGHYGSSSPVYKELAAIKANAKRTPTILIDDVCLFGAYGITQERVKRDLMAICPDFEISYEDGIPGSSSRKDDIMVAQWKLQ